MRRTVCTWCKRPFDAARSTARYCSGSCRAKASTAARHNRNQPQSDGTVRRSTALTSALTRAIHRKRRDPIDAAIVALARVYARALDADRNRLRTLGPQYLAVLKAAGLAEPLTQPAEPPGRDALDELRERRDARRNVRKTPGIGREPQDG